MTRLYLVTDRRLLGRDPGALRSLVRLVADAASAGIGLIQLRERDLSARDLYALTADVVAAAGSGARVLVNDRLDVALGAGAAGVHLRTTSLPTAAARGAAGPAFLIGVSAHGRGELEAAHAAGADFAVLGPVFATPSKDGMGDPLGVGAFGGAVAGLGIPVYALGGVRLAEARDLARAGAAGLAGIRLFHEAWLTGGADALAELAASADAAWGHR